MTGFNDNFDRAKANRLTSRKKYRNLLTIALVALMILTPMGRVHSVANSTLVQLSTAIKLEKNTFKTDAVQILEQIGMLKGAGEGITEEYLQTPAQRYQIAIMILRLKKFEAESLQYGPAADRGDFTDMIGPNALNMWGEGKNMMRFMKNHPVLGFSGYPDGSMQPYVVADGHVYYKVLLEILGYEIGIDYSWNKSLTNDLPDVMEMANSLGWNELDDVYNIPTQFAGSSDVEGLMNSGFDYMTVEKLAEATVDALTTEVQNSSQTLAEELGIDFDGSGDTDDDNQYVDEVNYDFSKYENMSQQELKEHFAFVGSTDLMRGPYNMTGGDVDPNFINDIYADFINQENLDHYIKVFNIFLVQQGYLDGEITEEYGYDYWHEQLYQFHLDNKWGLKNPGVNADMIVAAFIHQRFMFGQYGVDAITVDTKLTAGEVGTAGYQEHNVKVDEGQALIEFLEYSALCNGLDTTNASHKLFIDEHTNIQYAFIDDQFEAVGLIFDELEVSKDFYNNVEVIRINSSEFDK